MSRKLDLHMRTSIILRQPMLPQGPELIDQGGAVVGEAGITPL